MAIAFLVGQVIVGLYFLMNAYSHIVKGSHMTGYAASKGVPSPGRAIFLSGLLLLVGGLSILLGVWTFWGIIALIVFLVPVTFKMHDFWNQTDPAARMNEKISFTKNMALVGLLLMLLSIPSWPYSIL
jgi:putative oxidoreductase